MLEPRWKKVLGDLWGNKIRTMLVVLSIFVGVFAVGMIAGAQAILSRELHRDYLSIDPAHASIATGSIIAFNEDYSLEFRPASGKGFTDDLIDVVRHMDGVAEAEGRRNFYVQVKIGNRWHSLQLIAIDDYEDIRINKIHHVHGVWPPPKKSILIERSGMPTLGADVGEMITIERPDGKQRHLRVAGVIHDLTQWPTSFLGNYYGYVTFDTMEWLGQPHTYNQMLIRVAGNATSKEHNTVVARQVYDKIQKSGRDPSFPNVPDPNQHPLHFLITAITAMMGLLAIFAIFLSGFLVTNTISALLAQQIKQIGVMKSVGARTTQIMVIYLVLVVCFGLMALLPAIPLAQLAASAFADYIAEFMNFTIANALPPPYVVIIQVAVSIIVPIGAALVPVYSGTHITIREALASGGGRETYGTGLFDHLIQRVRGLPRPLLLSLRNTFRRKMRVMLTLITLTLGGAFFISIFSVRGSLNHTLAVMMEAIYGHDIEVYLNHSYRAEHMEQEARRVPGVVAAESAAQTNVRRIYLDDTESLNISLFAVKPDTQTMNPSVLDGRWLKPTDENALVVSAGILKDDPDMTVGSEVVLKVKEDETTWKVVGLMQAIGGARWAYTTYDYYTRVAREPGHASYLRVITRQHTGEYQAQVATRLEDYFKRRSIDVSSTKTMAELSQGDREVVELITISLMLIAVLVAIVGSLGLAGMMSLNVIERTREIGIMRAIGASNWSVLQIFMTEGIVIGLIGWAIGSLLAIPISQMLSGVLGEMLFSNPLNFNFSFSGIIIWLILSLLLAAIASFFPAWRATHVSVREVLAYE